MRPQSEPHAHDILRSALYGIGYGVIAIKGDGRIIQMNQCAERLTGWSEKDALDKPLDDVLRVVNEATGERVESPGAVALRSSDVAELSSHCMLVARDGTQRPIVESGAPIHDEEGEVVGAVVMFRDQTRERNEQRRLQNRVSLASVVADLSLHLLGSVGADDDAAIHQALARVGELIGADRSYVFLIDETGTKTSNTHEVCAEGIEPQRENLQDLPCDMFPWWMQKLRAGEMIHVPSVAQLPRGASAEKVLLEGQSIQSVLVVPLAWEGRLAGFVGFDAVHRARDWDEEDLLVLGTLANLLSLSFQRKQTTHALELEREQLLSVFQSIDEPIYVADVDTYEILFANEHLERMCGGPLVGQICYRVLQGREEPCPFCTNSGLQELGSESYHWEHYNAKLDAYYHIIDRMIRWPDGRDVRFELAIDVTAANRAHEALVESEARYRLITSRMAEVVLVADEQLRLSYVSPSAGRLFGYSDKEATSGGLASFLAAESLSQVRACLAKHLEALSTTSRASLTPVTMELEVLRKDGSTLFVGSEPIVDVR